MKDKLEVVTGEIGDTWYAALRIIYSNNQLMLFRIHGVASDPVKVSQIREIMRARTDCVHQAKCDETDARYCHARHLCISKTFNYLYIRFYNFSRLLLKGPEHTWGGDTKKFLNDYTNWTNKDVSATADRGTIRGITS